MPKVKSEPVSLSHDKCKQVPYSVFIKIKGSEKHYQEALEASSSFNKRLLKDRKMRIPFIDSQTRVAQSNSMLWLMRYQRTKPDLHDSQNGFVHVYPNRKWYKHRRLQIDPNDLSLFHSTHLYKSQPPPDLNENSNSMDSLIFHHASSSSSLHHPMLSKQSSLSNDDYESETLIYANGHHNHHHQPAPPPQIQPQHHSHSSHHTNHHTNFNHLHDDSFENFETNDHEKDSEEDDYEDSKKKKKRGKGKKRNDAATNGDDKPFVCDRCGVKYKTKPGLTYHIQKAHTNNEVGTSTPNSKSNSSNNNHLKQSEPINPDENTTNSVFESGYDDMNSSSSQPQLSSNNTQNQTATSHSINSNNKNSSNKCGICTGSESENRMHQAEKFIACYECNKSFHPTCLNFSANMLQSVKKYNWLCIECKKCTHCGNSENDDKLLFCDDCDRGYHMYCLKPPLQEAPDGDWRCELCTKQFGSCD